MSWSWSLVDGPHVDILEYPLPQLPHWKNSHFKHINYSSKLLAFESHQNWMAQFLGTQRLVGWFLASCCCCCCCWCCPRLDKVGNLINYGKYKERSSQDDTGGQKDPPRALGHSVYHVYKNLICLPVRRPLFNLPQFCGHTSGRVFGHSGICFD